MAEITQEERLALIHLLNNGASDQDFDLEAARRCAEKVLELLSPQPTQQNNGAPSGHSGSSRGHSSRPRKPRRSSTRQRDPYPSVSSPASRYGLSNQSNASRLVCPICRGPGRKSATKHCQTCYSGLYNDIKKVVTRAAESGAPVRRFPSTEADLENLAQLIKNANTCQTNYTCTVEQFKHNLPVQRRCKRCRSLATIRILPEVSHSILINQLNGPSDELPVQKFSSNQSHHANQHQELTAAAEAIASDQQSAGNPLGFPLNLSRQYFGPPSGGPMPGFNPHGHGGQGF